MGDLKSRRWIVARGLLFLLLAVLSAGLILYDSPMLRTASLLAVLVWSSARFYYFIFCVLERYVDSSLRYSGLMALIKAIWQQSRRRSSDREE